MLIEEAILSAMVVWELYTPLEIGDAIGEDKFRVLRLLRGLESIGLVKSRPCLTMLAVERYYADHKQFTPRRLAWKVYSTKYILATPTP